MCCICTHLSNTPQFILSMRHLCCNGAKDIIFWYRLGRTTTNPDSHNNYFSHFKRMHSKNLYPNSVVFEKLLSVVSLFLPRSIVYVRRAHYFCPGPMLPDFGGLWFFCGPWSIGWIFDVRGNGFVRHGLHVASSLVFLVCVMSLMLMLPNRNFFFWWGERWLMGWI